MRVEPSQIVSVLEKTIDDLADDFYEESAFSFATEADVQSTLLGRLRAKVLLNTKVGDTKIQLAHAESPAFGTSWKGSPRHDLTIWHPDYVSQARENWGTPVRGWPQQLQKRLNLVAIELELFAGLPWDIRQYEIFSAKAQSVVAAKVREHSDIRKLKESWIEFGYFLIFWDDDVQAKDDLKICFSLMREACAELAAKAPKLRFNCICRDRSVFQIP